MNNFIMEIYRFCRSIVTGVRNAVATIETQDTLTIYDTFLNKNMFTENSLIGLNITWYELVRFVPIFILSIFFIALFVKFVFYIIKWVGGFLSD